MPISTRLSGMIRLYSIIIHMVLSHFLGNDSMFAPKELKRGGCRGVGAGCRGQFTERKLTR